MAVTSDFDRDYSARLRAVLDAETGPHPSWADAPAARRVAERRRRRGTSLRLLAVAAVLLVGGALVGGLLVGRIRPPTGPVSNGWIVFEGGGGELYVVRDRVAPRRVVGIDDDPFIEACPVFSPDGSRLAYIEFDERFVTPTAAPQPSIAEGEPTPEPTVRPTPRPTPEPGASKVRLLVVEIGEDGSPTTAPIELTSGDDFSCPRWSPDGTRIAAVSDASALFVVDLAGKVTPLGPSLQHPGLSNHTDFDWSPDGATMAVSDSETSWLVPTNAGPFHALPAKAWVMRWSPDGRHLAADVGPDVVLMDPDGAIVETLIDRSGEGPANPWAWSPDGTRIAYVEGNDVVTVTALGAQRSTRPFATETDGAVNAWLAGWSPAGDRILVVKSLADVERSPMSLVSVPVDPDAAPVNLLGSDDAYFGGGTSWQARND